MRFFVVFCLFLALNSLAKAEEVVRIFSWNFRGESFGIGALVDSKVYQEYMNTEPSVKAKKRLGIHMSKELGSKEKWWEEALRELTILLPEDSCIYFLAESFKILAKEKGLTTDRDLVELAVSFIQSGVGVDQKKVDTYYRAEANGQDGAQAIDEKYPCQTLFDCKGVCQDKSILLYCLLKKLGFGTCLIVIEPTDPNKKAKHIGCGIYTGQNYLYIETMETNMPIGQTTGHFNFNGQCRYVKLIPTIGKTY